MDATSPIKDIPDCWKDEKRMNALFAPFRKKEINPIDWESKMKFWHTVIEKWCSERNQASFSVQLIQKEFKRNGRTPVCVATAVQELVRNGQVKNKNEFLLTNPNQSWSSWAVSSLVKAPASWSLSILKSYWSPEVTEVQPDEEFVTLPFLKAKSEKLYFEAESLNENVICLKEISQMLSKDEAPMSEDTVNCVIHYLCLEGMASVETVGDTKLVKLLRKGKSDTLEITQADLAIFKLQQNRAVLERNIDHLEMEKDKCVEEAKACLSKGKQVSAKTCLRKKKHLEKCIEKRVIALDNLESLLASLRNTESDSKVLDAYKVGLAALKGTFKSSGLSEDGVFETMAQLQEMNDIQDEIQMAMAQPVASNVGDTDLEEELEEILAKSPPEANHSKSINLPDVPTHSLDSSLMETLAKKAKSSVPEPLLS